MDCTLSTCSCASDKSIHKIVLLKDWLDTLKELDIQLQADHAECCTELDAITMKFHAKSCDDHAPFELSWKMSTTASSSQPSHSSSKDYPLKLMWGRAIASQQQQLHQMPQTLHLSHERWQSLKGQVWLPKRNQVPTHHPSHCGCLSLHQWEQEGEKTHSHHHFC